jgi:hypothetical protein
VERNVDEEQHFAPIRLERSVLAVNVLERDVVKRFGGGEGKRGSHNRGQQKQNGFHAGNHAPDRANCQMTRRLQPNVVVASLGGQAKKCCCHNVAQSQWKRHWLDAVCSDVRTDASRPCPATVLIVP